MNIASLKTIVKTTAKKLVRPMRVALFLTALAVVGLLYVKLPTKQFFILALAAVLIYFPVKFVASMVVDIWMGTVQKRKVLVLVTVVILISFLRVFVPQAAEKAPWLNDVTNPVITWVQEAWGDNTQQNSDNGQIVAMPNSCTFNVESSLILYATPDLSSQIIASINGGQAQAIGQTVDNQWVRLAWQNSAGWALAASMQNLCQNLTIMS